jgi:hypothetical protein
VQLDSVLVLLPVHDSPVDFLDAVSILRESDKVILTFGQVFQCPTQAEFHWDLHHIPFSGPYLRVDGSDRTPVVPCEVLSTEDSNRFEKAPFRATRVFDTPTGVKLGLVKKDFDKYFGPVTTKLETAQNPAIGSL